MNKIQRETPATTKQQIYYDYHKNKVAQYLEAMKKKKKWRKKNIEDIENKNYS